MAKVKKNLSTAEKPKLDGAQITEAVDYRLQGFSYEQIGEQMKITAQLATELVGAGLVALIRDDPIQRLRIDLQRIDQMLTAVYPNAANGDVNAINATLSLRKEREVIEKKFERMESFRRLAPLEESAHD